MVTQGEVVLAAELSELAYRPDAWVRKECREMGFGGVVTVEAGGMFAVICSSADCTWIVFRGTQLRDWQDINADRKFLPRRTDSGLVHRGFAAAFDTIWQAIEPQLAGVTGRVICTGHSLGGALATLCAERLGKWQLAALRARPDLITLGCPLVGSAGFIGSLQAVTGDIVRVTNGNDPIPWLFLWPVYWHPSGHRIHLTGDGAVMVRPTRWKLLGALECGRAQGIAKFIVDVCKTRSLFRSWLRVTSVFDHMVIRYREQLQFVFREQTDAVL